MSYHDAEQPLCSGSEGAIDLVIEPRERDLGGFSVRRVLPSKDRKMVGPFIFFDQMGPAEFPPGEGIQVRPHPHIGLATITYLFEGEMMHRDSLGYVQPIRPGAVNLMTAGRGIVHSERAGDDIDRLSRAHGIQSWIALPDHEEEREPGFVHYPAEDLPRFEVDGVSVTIIMGEAYGRVSPVQRYSPTLYLECAIPKGSALELPSGVAELAAYVVSGEIAIGTCTFGAGVMAVARAGETIRIEGRADSRVMVIGGDPVGHREIWWNLVSSSKDRIEQAKRDWKEERFDEIPGETERIPLPD